MKENDIRPRTLILESEKCRAIDLDNILRHVSNFVRVACPACDCDSSKYAFAKHGFDFVKCIKCSTLYVNPRPTPDMLAQHYQTSLVSQYWNEHVYPASESRRREQIFQPRAQRVIELCQRYGVRTGCLVDVGAGFGTFCEEIQKLNFFTEIIAVEPSSHLADSCRGKGVRVIETTVEELQLESPPDVITNFELIEHLYDPHVFLEHVCSRLNSGGLLVITTPNIRGFDLLVLGELSENINAPNHLNYFHAESLSLLIQRSGLEILEVLTPGKLDVDLVLNKLNDGTLRFDDQPFLEELFTRQPEKVLAAFQEFLGSNGMSSHLWIVARKP